MIKTQNIVCDIGTQTAQPIHFVQGENGREVSFTFVNTLIMIEDEPQPVSLSGLTATIHILKPDGNFVIDRMSVSGNEASYTLGENACIAGGAGVYDIALSKGSDIIYTAHGAYVGDFRAISDDVVNSVSEAYGVVFPEGFQEKLIAGDKITIEDNVISAEGEVYTAGDNIQISDDNVISATDTNTTYTAGTGINISNDNVISADTSSTYSETILYEGSASMDIILSDSILNYDAFYIEGLFGGNTIMGCVILCDIFTNNLGVIHMDFLSHGAGYLGITPNSTATHFVFFQNGANGCTKLIGINF